MRSTASFPAEVGGGFCPSSFCQQDRYVSSESEVNIAINRAFTCLAKSKKNFFFKRISESQTACACKSEQVELFLQDQTTNTYHYFLRIKTMKLACRWQDLRVVPHLCVAAFLLCSSEPSSSSFSSCVWASLYRNLSRNPQLPDIVNLPISPLFAQSIEEYYREKKMHLH